MTDYKNHPTIKKLLKESYVNPDYRGCLCNFNISDIKELYVYNSTMPIATLIAGDGLYRFYGPHSFATNDPIDVYFLCQKISVQIKNSRIYSINVRLMCILSNDPFYKVGTSATVCLLKGDFVSKLIKV